MKSLLSAPRRGLRAVVAVCGLLWFAPLDADAQVLVGRVQLAGAGVADQEVVLHRVTRDTAGVVGQTTSDAQGRFAISLPPVDTAGFTVFFATVDYLGVRYFGFPIHPGQPTDAYEVAVFDTVSVNAPDAPLLRLARRDVVMLPESDGGWEVNEVVRLVNSGDRTIISQDGRGSWEFLIPPGAIAFELGEGEIAGSEVVRVDDRALLLAPLLPGPREVFVRYRMPANPRELRIPIGTPADSLKVFVQLPSPEVNVSGLEVLPLVQTDAGQFLSFAAADVSHDAAVRVTWVGPAGPPVSPTTAALTIIAVFLVTGTLAAIFVRRSAPAG
jgi:hypothetical protein